MSRYDVKSILESSTLPIGGAAKRLKEMEHVELMSVDSHSHSHRSSTEEDSNSMSSHLTDGINNYGVTATHHHGWPSTLAFQQLPHHMQYPYGHRLWCKQEQDSSSVDNSYHNFQDLHQLQLGNNTHNFLQSNNSGFHSFMCLDSTSMDNGYGDGGGYMIPMGTNTASTVIANDGNQNQRNNGFGDNNEVKMPCYESVYGSSTDPYHARNLYYLSHQSSVDGVKASAYDQGSTCNTWVPTAIPTLAPTNSNMALCHGAPPFTILHE